MQWSDYTKIANGIYTHANEPAKPVSTRTKLVVAEGLSEKNLLKMPGKLSAPVRSMENDLRRFVSGKPILNEVAPLVAAAVPALLGAGEVAVGGAGAAAAGAAAEGAAAGSVAGAAEGAAAGASEGAGSVSASSLASDKEMGKFVSDVASNTKIGDTSQTSHPNEQEVDNAN